MADDWRTRRSKSGDHGPVNSSYGEKMKLRNLKDIKARTLVADTIDLVGFISKLLRLTWTKCFVI